MTALFGQCLLYRNQQDLLYGYGYVYVLMYGEHADVHGESKAYYENRVLKKYPQQQTY
jgi:hypothetical protein